MEMSSAAGLLSGPGPAGLNRKHPNFAHCPNFIADFAGGAFAAVSGDAVLSHRPSGLGADGLALAQGRAGQPTMDRFQGDFAVAAALGGGRRRRQILQPSRRRLGCAARRDGRRRGGRGHSRRLDHHPYLNIAELGPTGQFGAEAGSNYAFGRSAATLSPREAALLAAILPNPVRRSARNPGSGVRRLAGTYMARANAAALARCWSENRAF